MLICGVDEVGRGCFAGDVVAGAVVFDAQLTADDARLLLPNLRDSKKLSEKQREALFPLIQRNAVAQAVGSATVHEIETLGIVPATHLAMRRAVDALDVRPDRIVVDGNVAPMLSDDNIPVECLVKADSIVPAVMAAAILAKVTRDRVMVELSMDYPAYAWKKNKGYGTATHIAAIRAHGLTCWHRASFCKKFVID